jgi:phosphatidylglycerophosphate synthase
MITLSRLPLLLISVLLLYLGSFGLAILGTVLLGVGLLLDTVDGMVARRTGQTSLLGSVLDIAADRIYELVLWVFFAHLGLIPIAIPLIVIGRTTLTDALRSIGTAEGTAPFAQHQSALGRFLVASPWMRTGYSIGKVVAFCGLGLAQALRRLPVAPGGPSLMSSILTGLEICAWIVVSICVVRGLPVIAHSVRTYFPKRAPAAPVRALQDGLAEQPMS